MKPKLSVNVKSLLSTLSGAKLTRSDMLTIEGAGAAIISNGEKNRVAVDTGATRSSIKSHIVTATESKVEDEIGPETVYAPNIEFGRQDQPNYPIQPFIRPTVAEDGKKAQNAISNAFGDIVRKKWQK